MIYFLTGVTVLAHLIVPFIFLWWVARNKGNSLLYRIGVSALVGSFLLTMWVAGAGWAWFGHWWASLFLILFIPAIILMIKKSKGVPWLPPKKIQSWLGTLTVITLAVLSSIGLPSLLNSRSYNEKPINLFFPLRGGTYMIAQGGGNESVNAHYNVHAQKYALDVFKLNNFGVRANGLLPKDLTKYEIFNDQLFAPCSGKVLSVKNNLEDLIPPKMDSKNLLGNHVIIFCKGHSILLAHLKKGSLAVHIGENINEGDYIGNVGNSGNTTEPHLHMHAVKGNATATKEVTNSAEGVPMIFDNKFLIRNDKVTYKK